MVEFNRSLPEFTIGRAGRDFFSHRKDLTVILYPFERYTSFTRAIDELYQTLDVPFNLIVMENNAPESVREVLEQKQRQHGNITVIYSDHVCSTGHLLNLALPHVKTNFVFIADNELSMPRGSVEALLKCAKEENGEIVVPANCFVPRQVRIGDRPENIHRQMFQSIGIHLCFLASRNVFNRLPQWDETASPLALGIDFYLIARQNDIVFSTLPGISVEAHTESSSLLPEDMLLYAFQWDEKRINHSLNHFEEKWQMALDELHYKRWIDRKRQALNDHSFIPPALTRAFARFPFSLVKSEVNLKKSDAAGNLAEVSYR